MKKVLIIRFSSIGDIVLTTPVARCIKQQLKDVELHFLTKPSFSSIVKSNPFIDKVIELEDSLGLTITQLKKEKYDCIVDLHHNIRTLRIKLSLGVKSFSFNKLNIEKWLMVNFKIDRLPAVHIVDRYFETVKYLGVQNDGKGLDFFSQSNEETVLQTLPAEARSNYVGFVIGAKHNTKKLPIGKIIAICTKINQPVVLLGGKEDVTAGNEIVSKSHQQFIFNACGKYSLDESAVLVKHASVIITHDTGLMHIAAAYKKKIISVWGNTIPEFGMTPYYGQYEIQQSVFSVQQLSCRPCSKIGFEKCPKGHFYCMNKINEDEVIHALKAGKQ